MAARKLKVSTTGYKENSKDKNLKELYVPSPNLTMTNVNRPVKATPVYDNGGYGMPITMMPGVPTYSFPGAMGVIEEKFANGGDISVPDLRRVRINALPKAQSTGELKEQALQRDWNRQQARAWDPNELNGAQEVPTDNVVVKPMAIAPPAKNPPKKSKEQIAKEAAVKTNKKAQNDPTLWLLEHPEYTLDADGNPVLRTMMEQAAPEELKSGDIKQAKEEFVKDLNSDPLQQSLGTASLDNPVTNAAAERYADYTVNNIDPGKTEDQMFRGYMAPTTRDFYQPNNASNTVRGAAALGATAAGVAGLSAGITALPVLGEAAYAWGAANPFISATGAALTSSPTWAPGLSMANALNAGFITHGVSQLPETYKAWDNAINNGGSYLDATGQTLLNSLDFLGVGELKAPGILDDIIKTSIKEATAVGADPAKVFVENLGKQGIIKPEAISSFTKEQWQEAAKFLERRQFVKQLQKDKLIGEGVKPADVNYFARFNDRVNRLTQNALDADATLYRGVRGDKPHAGYQEYTGMEYDMMKPAWGNEISEYENMVRAGVDFENPLSIAEYQATHVPMESYGYRAGMPDMGKVDAIYATSEPSDYYGNYLFEMKLPRDYNKGNFKDWYDKYFKEQRYLHDDIWGAEEKAGRSIYDYVPPTNKEIPLRLSRSGYPIVIGKKGEKLLSVNKDFPFTDLKRLNTDPAYAKAFDEYREAVRNGYHTGWINDELDLTSLYRIEPKGASFPTYVDPNDLRYTEWSGDLNNFLQNPSYANELMQHPDIYKTFVDPKTGKRNVGTFYPQSTEGNWWTTINPDKKALSGVFLNKGATQVLEVKVPKKILPNYEAHKVSGWAGSPHPDKPEWILPSEWRSKAKITEWDPSKKKIMSPFLKESESPEYLNILQNEYNSLTEKGVENLTQDELLKALDLEAKLNKAGDTSGEILDAAQNSNTPKNLAKQDIKSSHSDLANLTDELRRYRTKFWQSPIGKARLEAVIENTPELKAANLTVDDYIRNVRSMSVDNRDAVSDLLRAKSISEELKSEAKRLEEMEFLEKETGMTHPDQYMMNSLRERVKMLKQEFDDEMDEFYSRRVNSTHKDNAYMAREQPQVTSAPGTINLEKAGVNKNTHFIIGIGQTYDLNQAERVLNHELGHLIQRGVMTNLDKELQGLDLLKSEASDLFSSANKKPSYFEDALNYFKGGSEGKEKLPFLEEVRSDMLQKGIIKDFGDPITEGMIRQHYANYMIEGRSHKAALRIYDIMKNNPKNFKLLNNVMNKMPVAIIGTGVGLQMMGGDEEGQVLPQKKRGGGIKNVDFLASRNKGIINSLPKAQTGVDWEAVKNPELAAKAQAMGHETIADYRNSNWGYGKNMQRPPVINEDLRSRLMAQQEISSLEKQQMFPGRGAALGIGLDTQLPKPVSLKTLPNKRKTFLNMPMDNRQMPALEEIFKLQKPEQSGVGRFLGNPNAKAAPLGFEEEVNKYFGNPMDKAYAISEAFAGEGEDPVDNFRHPMAGMYTQQAIKDKVGIPFIGDALGFLGSNAMGIGHELGTMFKDERDWDVKLREAGEDTFNNFTGSLMGLLPGTQEDKQNMLYNLSSGNWLPDGVVWNEDKNQNMYFKDENGNVTRRSPSEMLNSISYEKQGGATKRVTIKSLPKNWKSR
jgi:hypothetical protein